MLRDIEFTHYDPTEKDECSFPPLVSRAWSIFYNAVGSAPSGSVEQTERGVSVFKKLKLISEAGSVDGARRLKSKGATLRLTNEELDYSKKQVERIRENVPISQGDALMLLGSLFATAKEVDETKLMEAP